MNDTAYEAALRILVRRPHAEGELAAKLRKKEFPPEEIAVTLAQLRTEKQLNDPKLAREYVQWHLDYKPMGRRGIVQRLRLRKFKEPDIEAAVGELVTPEAERAGALRLLESRLQHSDLAKLPPAKKRDRLARYLLARGFDTELVLSLLDSTPAVT
ncbi:MAG: regulatory protein RecX [Candidatus Andersenbacteria bacterium]